MGPRYDPAPGITSFLAGTPDIVGAVAVEEGARLLAEAGLPPLRAKSTALTEYLIDLAREWLVDSGFTIATPREASRRGGHVSLRHDDAWQLTQALLRTGVVADYRTPDRIRVAPAPLYTSFTHVWDGMDRLREIAASKSYADIPPEPAAGMS
jgi:kynureninase